MTDMILDARTAGSRREHVEWHRWWTRGKRPDTTEPSIALCQWLRRNLRASRILNHSNAESPPVEFAGATDDQEHRPHDVTLTIGLNIPVPSTYAWVFALLQPFRKGCTASTILHTLSTSSLSWWDADLQMYQ